MVTCPLRRNCTSRGFVWIATYLNEIRSAKIWLDERQGVFNCRIGLLRPIAKNPFFSLGNTKNWKYFIWAYQRETREWHIEGSYFLPFEENEKMGLICDICLEFSICHCYYINPNWLLSWGIPDTRGRNQGPPVIGSNEFS